MLTPELFAKVFDMAVLAPDTREAAIRAACAQAKDVDVAALYTNPCWTPVVADELAGSGVRTGVALGFPYGTTTLRTKLAEAEEALAAGGTALDMVINIGALKDGNLALVRDEVRGLVELCRGRALAKVIYEVCFLSDDEIRTLTGICVEEGVDWIKTSTGSQGLPDAHHLEVMKEGLVGSTTQLKLSGVPRQFTLAACLWMLDMGVTLIGTRSAPRLVDEYREHLARLTTSTVHD
ncbi:deoxyribose-phosphate aldolase [Actinotalea sp. M2MS4P-6]|uniref:deoxyribose-phosphate aldolase n=1 Tax=Actinotalea sp. M2MS4P-6 TaxID=2983762 RepID=UPI0021E406DB|nr:deoxyribose-phosphate aldolase [Actinotalea sp. M2MS4P-6]MCV2395652.1 deoxyribose-phosphate aldolase [Actinotalea sp. M2MS4P-6]